MTYYGRMYPEPPLDEVHALIKRAEEDLHITWSRIDNLLSDVPVPVSDAVRSAMREILGLLGDASSAVYAARFDQDEDA